LDAIKYNNATTIIRLVLVGWCQIIVWQEVPT